MNKFFDRIIFDEDYNKKSIGPYMVENLKLDYDENATKIPLEQYYQSYPFIKIQPKNILNLIYNIYNIENLIKWTTINIDKNKYTLYRVLDLSWVVFNKKIFLYINKIKEIYKKILFEKEKINEKRAEIILNELIYENNIFNNDEYFSKKLFNLI